jgi:hypothetical protein
MSEYATGSRNQNATTSNSSSTSQPAAKRSGKPATAESRGMTIGPSGTDMPKDVLADEVSNAKTRVVGREQVHKGMWLLLALGYKHGVRDGQVVVLQIPNGHRRSTVADCKDQTCRAFFKATEVSDLDITEGPRSVTINPTAED